jgi:hypothetical protein
MYYGNFMKIRRLISLLPFAALILTTNLSGQNNFRSDVKKDAEYIRLRPEDEILVETALAAVKIAPKMDGVWRNYWRENQPIIIYKSGKSALLVSNVAPPLPFRPIDKSALPGKLRGRAYFYPGALPGLVGNFNTDYRVGDVSAIAVKLEENSFKTLAVLFHEAFHKFQEKNFSRTIGAASIELAAENPLPSKIIANAEFVAAMELERRTLAAAVAQYKNREVLISLLRQYLAVRQQRNEKLPPDVRHAELNIERKEGTASIVGYESAYLAIRQDEHQRFEQLKMFLGEPPSSLPFGKSPFERFRARAFGSGAAIAWLLSRMKFDWRARSQQGASFESLLAEAVKFNSANAENLGRTAFEQNGFKELLAQAEEWKTEFGSELTEEDFYRLGRVRLILNVPSANRQYPSFVGKATGIPSQPAENIVINPTATLLELDYQKILLSAEKRPYLLNLTKAPEIFQAVIMLDKMPGIEGIGSGMTKIEWLSGGTIEGEGVKLKLERSATVEVNEGRITVNIQPFKP